MRKKSILISILCLMMVFVSSCSSSKDEEVITMGFVPLVDGDKLIESVEPLSEILTEKMGTKVEAFTASNYVGVVEGLGSGKVDFGIIPPFAYVLANKEFDSQVVLTSINDKGEAGYYSVIMTRKDSGITDVKDLKGKKIAFVDPSSTSGYLFPGAYLIENGIDIEKDIEYEYSGGHDKSLQMLLNKDVDAIATFEAVDLRYQEEFPNAKEEVQTIAKTEMIPGISVTVSSKMDEETKQKLTETLENITEDPEAKKLLEELFGLYGFKKAGPEDYEVIKKTAEIMNVDLSK